MDTTKKTDFADGFFKNSAQIFHNNMQNDEFTIDIIYYNHRHQTPEWHTLPHIIEYTDITYIISGNAEYCINDKTYPVRAGDLLYIKPFSKRSFRTFQDSPVDAQCLNLNIRSFDGTPYFLPFPVISHIEEYSQIAPCWKEIQKAFLMKETGYRLHLQAHALLLMEKLYQFVFLDKEAHPLDSRIQKVMEYVAAHYYEQIKLSDVAQMVSLNPTYFGSLFKTQTNMTFQQYITSVRIDQAENMLLYGENNVGEVAEMCGFSDVFYFSKVFSKLKGISPSKVLHLHVPTK